MLKEKAVKKYIRGLTKEDVDLWDKLDNLSAAGQIPETLYNFLVKNEGLLDVIEDTVIDFAELFIEDIAEETENLYNQDVCEEDDWSAGLYNCDKLYLMAIKIIMLENFTDYEAGAFVGFNTKQLYVYLKLSDELTFVVDPPAAVLNSIGRYDCEMLDKIVARGPLWLFDAEYWLEVDEEV